VRTEREPAILAHRYVLQALLERSTAGMTWLATDTVLDRSVVVTLVDPRVARDGRVRERLIASTRALATATPTTLVRVLDAGMDDDVPFLVTERLPGETLDDVLRRDGPLPAERAAAIVATVLEGLSEARALGVARPDVRPSNVMVDEHGRVRIRETGVASAAIADATGQRAERVHAADDDVRAAGELLVELLTGRPVVDDVVVERVSAPRAIRTILSRSLVDGRHRFADGVAMAAALRRAAHAPGEPADPSDPAPRPRVFRTWIALPLAVAVLAGVVLGAGLRLGRLELGGPVGVRIEDEAPQETTSSSAEVDVASITVVDPPPGDGVENDDALLAVTDGDPTTVWRSENYYDGTLNKPGVGLVLDLGRERTVTGFRLSTPSPGFAFSLLVGDDPITMVEHASGSPAYTAPDARRGLGPRTGRYVVVWITSVVAAPDGGNRAEVSDVRVIGTT